MTLMDLKPTTIKVLLAIMELAASGCQTISKKHLIAHSRTSKPTVEESIYTLIEKKFITPAGAEMYALASSAPLLLGQQQALPAPEVTAQTEATPTEPQPEPEATEATTEAEKKNFFSYTTTTLIKESINTNIKVVARDKNEKNFLSLKKILLGVGIWENVAQSLCELPHATPEYINAHIAQWQIERQNGKNQTIGLLAKRIRDNDPMPITPKSDDDERLAYLGYLDQPEPTPEPAPEPAPEPTPTPDERLLAKVLFSLKSERIKVTPSVKNGKLDLSGVAIERHAGIIRVLTAHPIEGLQI